MAYTQAQADALRAGIAKGIKSVTYDGQTVVYRSVREMKEALDEIEKSLSGNTVKRTVYATKRGVR